MRIKKITQNTRGFNITDAVTDGGTDLNKDTFNGMQDNIEKAIDGIVLWENPNIDVEFIPQEVTLNSSDYNSYKIIFKTATTDDIAVIVEGVKGLGVCMMYINPAEDEYRIGARRVFYRDDTHMFFENAHYKNTINNIACIPVKIIGYK